MCVCVHVDMDTTADKAYKLAMDSIFVHKEEVHRFAMPSRSRKNPHRARWTLFEMWPINVRHLVEHVFMHSGVTGQNTVTWCVYSHVTCLQLCGVCTVM